MDNDPKKLEYVGFSSHDCDPKYRCPICKENYNGWDFINGRCKTYKMSWGYYKDKNVFECLKCKSILIDPR